MTPEKKSEVQSQRHSPVGVEGPNHHVVDSATVQRRVWSLFGQWMTPAGEQGSHSYNWRQLNAANGQGVGLEKNPAESVALANILISALWSPESRIQLPHACTSDLQKLWANKWCYFKPLNLCNLLRSNRKWILACAWQRAGCYSKLNSNGFGGMSFLAFHPRKFTFKKSLTWLVLLLSQLISNISNPLLWGILFWKAVCLS